MTPAIKASLRHWVFGTVIALAGVAISRVLATGFEGRVHAVFAVAGQVIALGGLFVILLGIRRRLHRANADAPPPVSF